MSVTRFYMHAKYYSTDTGHLLTALEPVGEDVAHSYYRCYDHYNKNLVCLWANRVSTKNPRYAKEGTYQAYVPEGIADFAKWYRVKAWRRSENDEWHENVTSKWWYRTQQDARDAFTAPVLLHPILDTMEAPA